MTDFNDYLKEIKMVDFNEAFGYADDFVVYLGDKEIKGLFSNFRINPSTIKEGYYCYDIRGGDDEDFCTLEDHVLVNHTGTFITKEKIEFPEKGYIDLKDSYSFM